MRRIITALLVLLTTSAIAQNGGQITGKKNSGLTGTVMLDSVALKVSDSASRVYLSAMKLKSDSIYKRMYQDSVNLAKLGTGVTTTLDSATQRSTIKVSGHDSTTDSRLGVKLLVNPTITNDSSTLSRTTIKVSNFPATQAVSGSVTATLDSATQRSTMKISNFPATQAVSGTFWQTTQPISGTITTTPPSNASSNISQINGITPLMGNGVTGTGSQRVTIASDNTAFSVNTIPSATDSTKYRGTMQISNFPATQPVSLSGNVNTTISGVVKKTLGTQVVSTDTGLVVNAVMHGLSTGGGGGYFDVKVNPSGALTVDATQSGTWNVNNVSGTISLPTGASTETTLSALNSKVPSGLSTAGSRLAIYSPDSIRVFATNGFGSGGSGGTTSLDAVDSTNLANTATNTSNTNSKLPSGLTVTSTRLLVDGSGVTQPISFTRLKASTDTVAISGTITATAGATTIFDSTWSATSMTVTNLNSLASSATVGWQSDSVRNNVRKAVNYKINVKLTMANTAPANDKAVYVYICPFYFDGTNWYAASQGTTTLPTGAQGASTIASPNNLRLLGVLSYTTQNQVCQDNFLLSNAFGNVMPDGFSIIIVNFSGAAVSASGNVVNYSPINKVQR
jgi:hypothetical protein